MRKSETIAIQKAATGITALPDHVVCNILSRLPLNSIFTCKRVCKTWRDLTLEPCFAKLYLSMFPLSLFSYRKEKNSTSHFQILQLQDPNDFGNYTTTTIKFTSTGTNFRRKRICMVASCNGLFLLASVVSRDLVIVCNPLRAQHLILPTLPPLSKKMTDEDGIVVGFGFGHSSVTNQYKVLRFNVSFISYGLNIDIFTLGIDDAWRSIVHTAHGPILYAPEFAFFLNGALHWISCEDSRLICYFDIEKEQFGSFPLPSHVGEARSYLGVVDNRLCIHNGPFGVWKLWMMKDYGDFGSWTLECVLEKSYTPWVRRFGTLECVVEKSYTPGVQRFVKPLKMLKDGSLLMSLQEHTMGICMPDRDKITLASYNPQTRVLRKIEYRDILFLDTPHAYVPCFFSPMDALE